MGKPSKDYAVPLWEKANLTVYETRFVKDVFCEKRLNYKLED